MGRPGAMRRRGGARQGRAVGGGGVDRGAGRPPGGRRPARRAVHAGGRADQGCAGEEGRRERGNSPWARRTAATAHRDPP
jgi:hypothetical protein